MESLDPLRVAVGFESLTHDSSFPLASPRSDTLPLGGGEECFGRAVSRILSAPVARRREPFISATDTRNPAGLRRSATSHRSGSLFGLAPGEVFRARLLNASGGGLLPRLFTLTGLSPGGLIFCGTVCPAGFRPAVPRVSRSTCAHQVTRPRALWSPDFPQPIHALQHGPTAILRPSEAPNPRGPIAPATTKNGNHLVNGCGTNIF